MRRHTTVYAAPVCCLVWQLFEQLPVAAAFSNLLSPLSSSRSFSRSDCVVNTGGGGERKIFQWDQADQPDEVDQENYW